MQDRGFIHDYKALILDHCPTNPDWAESVALTVLASGLNRHKYVVTKIGPLRFNIFTLMIGPSGLSNKTVPLLYYAIPTLLMLQEASKKDIILPARYSVEGMIEYMVKKASHGCIIRDEFTSLFKDVTNKKYMADGLEFLSEMYDGYIQKRATKTHKVEQPKDVYVNFIGATTPYLFTVMNVGFFMQGTGNRYLYVYDNPKESISYSPEEFLETPYKDYQAVSVSLQQYVKRMVEIVEKTPTKIGFEAPAAELLTNYRNAKMALATELYKKDFLNPEYSYITRLPEFALKLAGLHCISFNEESLGDLDELMVRQLSAKWAIDKVERHYDYFVKMTDAWSATAMNRPALTDASEIEYALSTLKNLGGEATHTKLRKALKWTDVRKFFNVMNLLVESGDITTYDGEGSSKGGPKPTIYCIVK